VNQRGCAVRPPPEEDPPLEPPPSADEPPLEVPPLELPPFELSPLELPPLEYPPLETDPPDDLVRDRAELVEESPAPLDDVPATPCAVSPASRGRTRV
jgi:hypothetical protein